VTCVGKRYATEIGVIAGSLLAWSSIEVPAACEHPIALESVPSVTNACFCQTLGRHQDYDPHAFKLTFRWVWTYIMKSLARGTMVSRCWPKGSYTQSFESDDGTEYLQGSRRGLRVRVQEDQVGRLSGCLGTSANDKVHIAI